MARRRLECLEKKMRGDPELADNLRSEIKKYLDKDYIRKLSEDQLLQISPRTWYLPIFSVCNPNKPGKFRMVFDAAARVKNISVNDMLLKGPDNLSLLLGVLIRFRERKIVICGDICEMFHQVRIREEDQQAQRFLWRDGDTSRLPDVYVMKVMTFGATCSPSTAQYIKNRNANEVKTQFPRAVQSITQNHYVDDMLDSTDNADEAIKLANEVKYIHARAGFNITKWVSNSPEVMTALHSAQTNLEKNLNLSDSYTTKVLGMSWCTNSYTFRYSVSTCASITKTCETEYTPTKREVLRVLMSIFDPLGLLSNFLIFLKIVLQDIWRSGIGWYDKLEAAELKKWRMWTSQLEHVATIQIPRCLTSDILRKNGTLQLHTFVDASEKAYAAVVYVRYKTSDEFKCMIVAAKTKVAPLKPQSIPRLELQAALLGTRLANSLKRMHTIIFDKTYFWTDSSNVLSWLRADQRKYRQFVAFRVGEIQESTEVNEWRWVPTKSNVADEATKWTGAPDLTSSSRWINGPEFLKGECNQWPMEKKFQSKSDDEELRTCNFHEQTANHSHTMLDINVDRFSNWSRLLRTVAYVIRAVTILKCSEKSYRKPSHH